MVNDTMGEEKNITYSTHCNVVHADEIIAPFFAGATNCTKDFMAVSRGMGVLWIFVRQDGCLSELCGWDLQKAPASFREVCWLCPPWHGPQLFEELISKLTVTMHMVWLQPY